MFWLYTLFKLMNQNERNNNGEFFLVGNNGSSFLFGEFLLPPPIHACIAAQNLPRSLLER